MTALFKYKKWPSVIPLENKEIKEKVMNVGIATKRSKKIF